MIRLFTGFNSLVSACELILLAVQSVFYVSQLKTGAVVINEPYNTSCRNGSKARSLTAVRILPEAFDASKALLIWGRANDTGLSLE